MPPKHVPGDDRSNATCQYLRSLGSLKSQPRRKQMNSIKEASQIMYIYNILGPPALKDGKGNLENLVAPLSNQSNYEVALVAKYCDSIDPPIKPFPFWLNKQTDFFSRPSWNVWAKIFRKNTATADPTKKTSPPFKLLFDRDAKDPFG